MSFENDNEFEDLEDLDTGSKQRDYKTNVFEKPNVDFPENKVREIVIQHGHASRTFFKGKLMMCKSFDGKTGKRKTVEGYEDESCAECGYVVGKAVEINGKTAVLQCQPGYTIEYQHPDPTKQFSCTVNKSTQINLERYRKELQKMNLRVTQVVTAVTRVKSAKYPGFELQFKLAKELAIQVSDLEKSKINNIIEAIKSGQSEDMSVPFVADMLMQMPTLKSAGLDKARALRIAKSVADENDMITAASEFLI